MVRPSTVVIVGRPNVGKSTLFNRLCENRRALTSPIPGTTRDWIEGTAHWGERTFQVVDTGGYAPGEEDVMVAVRGQVEKWVRDADLALWVVDAAEGLTAADQAIVRWLRKLAKNVLVVANKTDNAERENAGAEFYRAGFKKVVSVSASHGRNINDLLEEMGRLVPVAPGKQEEPDKNVARVALVGRPNVGKSSLMNHFLGEDRMIVSATPGTTRDTIDTAVEAGGKKFLFMDTAGLRSKKSKAVGLEGLTRIMSERALDRCDVALLLLDGTEGLKDGDTAVGRLIQEKNRACVVAVNKWDAVSDRHMASQWFRERQPADMPFLDYSPIIFISAKTGQNAPELLEAAWDAHVQYHRRFDDGELKDFFWAEVQNRPYSHRGKKLIFSDAKQAGSAPPTFVITSNLTGDEVHFSYQRHLENVFRARYKIAATPLMFRFKRK